MLHRYTPIKEVNEVDKFWGGSHVTLSSTGECCLLLFLLSRPSLYSNDFYSLFLFIYFSLVSLSFHILCLHVRTSDDLFWTYFLLGTFWWLIVYTYLSKWTLVPLLHDLLCRLVIFMVYFIYFFLVGLSLHNLWFPSCDLFFKHTFISVTYSVHMEVF